ncbi:MAG: WD40 repeat domain-containing protein, partial [Isosphaeraceae bacterium]
VKSLIVLPEQRLFVQTGMEGQIWDLPTRRMIGKGMKIDSQSFGLGVSSDAHRALLGRFSISSPTSVSSLELWDVPTARRLLALGAERKISGAFLDPSGTSLTYFTKDHTLDRYDLSRLVTDHPWLDDAGLLALIASSKPVTPRYYLKQQEPTILEVMHQESDLPACPPLHLDFPAKVSLLSPGNDLILTGCEDGSGQLWSPTTGAPVGIVMRHPQPVTCAAFSPNGRIIATGSGRTARFWDVYLSRPIGPVMDQPADVKAIFFSTDGRWLLVKCDDKGAERWPVPAPMEGDADRLLSRVREMTQ